VTPEKNYFKAIDSKFEAIQTQIGIINRDVGKIDMKVHALEEAREVHKMELMGTLHGLKEHDGAIDNIEKTVNSIATEIKILTKAISGIQGGVKVMAGSAGMAILLFIISTFIKMSS
jgi:chromosome segregation ATPase